MQSYDFHGFLDCYFTLVVLCRSMPHGPSAREITSCKMYFVMTLSLVKTSLDLDMETKVSRMANFYVSKWVFAFSGYPTRQTAKQQLFP